MIKYTTFDSFFNLVKSRFPFKDHDIKPAIFVDVRNYGSNNLFILGLLDETINVPCVVKLKFDEYFGEKEIKCTAIDKMIYKKNPYMMLRGSQEFNIDKFIDITKLEYSVVVQHYEKRINSMISNLLKTKGHFGISIHSYKLHTPRIFATTPYFKSIDELLIWNDLNPN